MCVDNYCRSEEYRKQHRFCPKCGCVRVMQTLACRYGAIDTNQAFCNCGWKGIAHGLTSIRVANACSCDKCVELIIDGEFEQ